MGDLNDDPNSPSIVNTLKATGNAAYLPTGYLFNPWDAFYKKGIGTLANKDNWGLFDQILLSGSWLAKKDGSFYYHSAGIFKRPFMIEQSGRFKGYPMRTWDGNLYRGGYSDHFPTYLVLIKSIK